jgi:hypothetical protein
MGKKGKGEGNVAGLEQFVGGGVRSKKLFQNCSTGILPVVEHGQDGRATKRPLVLKQLLRARV